MIFLNTQRHVIIKAYTVGFKMYTIIAGSRLLTKDEVYSVMSDVPMAVKITHVISGKAPMGGDYWGEKWAVERSIPVIPFPADWNNLDAPGAVIKENKYGKLYNKRAGRL